MLSCSCQWLRAVSHRPKLESRIYLPAQNIHDESSSVLHIIDNETSRLITYPFIHIMFNRFHKLGKRIAHCLLGGHIGEVIIDLRIINVDIIPGESEAEGHYWIGWLSSLLRHLGMCRWVVWSGPNVADDKNLSGLQVADKLAIDSQKNGLSKGKDQMITQYFSSKAFFSQTPRSDLHTKNCSGWYDD